MDIQKSLSVFTTILLKLGVIVFFFPFMYELWGNPGTEDEFWFWFIKLASLLIYVIITILILFLKRIKFYYFGFSLIMITSVYIIADLAFKYNFHPDQAVYFLLFTIAFYFMTKKERKQKRKF